MEVDENTVATILCGWIRDDVEDEIFVKLKNLPEHIMEKVKIEGSNIDMGVEEVEAYVHSYLIPEPDYERDDYYGNSSNFENTLEYIFK